MLNGPCHVLRGDLETARACLQRMARIHPDYSPLRHARRFAPRQSVPEYEALLAAAGWSG